MDSFNQVFFENRVSNALKEVDRILNLDRNPRLAGDVSHEYADKYALANTLTNTAIIAQMNVLDRLGLTNDILKKIDFTKATTLRFQAFDSCEFIKEQVVDVPVSTAFQTTEETTTTGSFPGNTKNSTVQEVVNRVKEFHWKVDVKWEISIYSGTNIENRIVLDSRGSSATLIVQLNEPEFPLPNREHEPIEVSLTWLLKQIDIEFSNVHFTINTQDKDAKTPRRNKQVDDALAFHVELSRWMGDVLEEVSVLYQDIINKHDPADPSSSTFNFGISQDSPCIDPVFFVPILPLMEEADRDQKIRFSEVVEQPSNDSALGFPIASADESNPSKMTRVLSGDDITLLLNEHVHSLDKARESVREGFPDRQSNSLFSVAEYEIMMLSDHSHKLADAYCNSINYIEKMLKDQLVSAIGKKVTSSDLDQFVRYHNGKMLNPPPKQFCHAIQRPNHYPEGILSIERDRTSEEEIEPIQTHVRGFDVLTPLKIPLNAATTLQLTGKTYLHGWLNNRFSTEHTTFQLIGRARQFSSFMLVVGTMIGPDCMQPKEAIIIQNKDEVKIPLLLNEIPTGKEFKDAINSLSPEQQRFAKGYRSMQLESSVVGICVIQIKPQLEDVLGLPHDSLTKEMQLTQDLMELFVEYQVPSDMMSYDEENQDATAKEKVDVVREHVKAVLDVIQDSKKKQLKEQEMKTDMARARATSRATSEQINPFLMDLPVGSCGGADEDNMGMMTHYPFLRSCAQPSACKEYSESESLSRILGMPENSMGTDNEMAYTFPSLPKEANEFERDGTKEVSRIHSLDFTGIPKLLDGAIEKCNADFALRSTTIKIGDRWKRMRREDLLCQPVSSTLNDDQIKTEKNKAFDLLDALSRSGSLPISYSELHVVVCVTHCFDKNVMDTVIEDNVNPIEKLEWSTLLLASTIHGVPARTLISHDSDKMRLGVTFPEFLGTAEEMDA
ncbi:hypothetical protein IV203_005266 [Nitzschia inconspicua]|uniref:Uncharacterized protein n=1 Tax=Nitzschia inconspicua TaxID=303405 RepID=A0A9K3PG65_9STRA|nr:hypothetical protein IV203_005266 [Nitzschia inconspicua]